jgi:hypothetical protein
MRAGNRTVPRARAVAAALALAVILLAGCGGSSSSTRTTRAAGSAATAAAPPSSNRAADQRVASDAELRLTDFPAGWKESARAQATGQSPCRSVEAAKAATSARGTSRDFSNNRDVPAAYSAVYLYADATTAGHWFDELSSRDTRSCLAAVLANGLANGSNGVGDKPDEITTGRVALQPIGDERAEARLTVPTGPDGASDDLNAAVIFVRVNRGVAVLTLLDTTKQFDQTLASRLARAVVDRLGARLNGTMP